MHTTLISYFPLIILFIIYSVICVMHAAFVKLSGMILHSLVVRWKHAFILQANTGHFQLDISFHRRREK